MPTPLVRCAHIPPVPKTMYCKTYHEMRRLNTFDERLEYLMMEGQVGNDTFGYDRYLNQMFYNARNNKRWASTRNAVILRDNGCELGIKDMDIVGPIIVHHIVPITKEDILQDSPRLYDLDNLVCVSQHVHNLIHYCSKGKRLPSTFERKPNDTCPWKH